MKSLKRLFVAVCLFPLMALGQENRQAETLVFDQAFYNCENRWVVFPKKTPAEPNFAYGFIYVDPTAGFTFDLQGKFVIDANGKFVATPMEKTGSWKYRLEGKINEVAVLSADRLKELGLPAEPDWYKGYKVDPGQVTTMVSWGKHYNHVGAFDKALVYLLKAYRLTPHSPGLEFELSYNYNATGKFGLALDVLNEAIKNDPKNFWYQRELGYIYMNTQKWDDAEKAYLAGIANCNLDKEKSEMAYNMAYGFFHAGNKLKFSEWREKTKSFVTDPNSVFLKNLTEMNAKLNEK